MRWTPTKVWSGHNWRIVAKLRSIGINNHLKTWKASLEQNWIERFKPSTCEMFSLMLPTTRSGRRKENKRMIMVMIGLGTPSYYILSLDSDTDTEVPESPSQLLVWECYQVPGGMCRTGTEATPWKVSGEEFEKHFLWFQHNVDSWVTKTQSLMSPPVTIPKNYIVANNVNINHKVPLGTKDGVSWTTTTTTTTERVKDQRWLQWNLIYDQ